MGKKLLRFVGAVGAALVGIAVPAQGQGPALAMEMRLRDPGNPTERLCVANGRRFIQLRNPESNCERFIVQDGPNDVTVQYTCRGKGYGRTHIRRETSRLVQIETQGIAAGLPFEFSAEARRVGDCSA